MNQTIASALRFGLLAVAAVAVTAFVLFTRGGDTAPAVALDTVADDGPAAVEPQSGPGGFPSGGAVAGIGGPDQPDFSISSAEDCTTNLPFVPPLLAGGPTPPDKKCLVAPGDSFTVDVALKDLGGIITELDYDSIAIRLDYSWNLTAKKTEAVSPVAAPGSPCDDDPKVGGGMDWQLDPVKGQYWIVCDAPFPTDYTGPLVSVTFNCPEEKTKEVVTLANNAPVETGLYYYSWGTALAPPLLLAGETAIEWIPDNDRHESLIINCDNYFPWDVHGPGGSAELDGVVDLPNDILGVIMHFCPLATMPCAKPTP